MEKIIELAKELGKELREHNATKVYMEASRALQSDQEAQNLLKEYERMVQEIARKESQLQPVEPSEKQELTKLQEQIAGNEKVKQLMQAQVEYTNLIRQVNQAIMDQIK